MLPQSSPVPSSRLDQFPKQFADPFFREDERLASFGRGAIESPRTPTDTLGPGFEIALALERVQHWIQGARADAVAVPCQLLNHPLPIELVFDSMMKDVQPDEPGEKVLMLALVDGQTAPYIGIRNREPILSEHR